jgi:hypothetical protein
VNSTQRRRTASKLLIDDPSLSLRQVAKIAGISPETVRDVRNRLHGRDTSGPASRGGLPRARHDIRDDERQGHTSRAPLGDLNQLVQQLKVDPTLRLTESGRVLLRWLEVHIIGSARWTELCDNIPAYCRGTIANVALECAEVWRKFSERLAEQDKCNSA